MSVGLGMPAPPAPTLAPRRKTRQLMVGDVGVGSDYPVAVQSMCTTKTHDVNSTLQQIAELTASGCDIVRVACPRQEDADALATIAKKSGKRGPSEYSCCRICCAELRYPSSAPKMSPLATV